MYIIGDLRDAKTEDDIKAIPDLAQDIAHLYYETLPDKSTRGGRCQITISTSFFVPKPFTPLQWAVMYPPEEYLHRASIVNHRMKEEPNHKCLSYQWHEAKTTVLEGIFARGDRRVAESIFMNRTVDMGQPVGPERITVRTR